MWYKKYAIVVAVSFLLIFLSTDALCKEQNPGSCLIYPYFNTTPTNMTIMTITNIGSMTVWVRVVWVEESNCAPADFWIYLTPLDTFTFLDNAMTPWPNQQGFIYAYACQGQFLKEEIEYNSLIGQSFVMESDIIGNINFSTNAQTFKALQIVPDGKLHLDAVEYEAAASVLFIPHFFGQPNVGGAGTMQSKIILINLTGGMFFRVRANTIIYNDNEQPFTDTIDFDCWEKWNLNIYSGATWRAFLLASAHNPAEPVGLPVQAESGWIILYGVQAYNPNGTVVIDNPSICAILFEGVQRWAFGADWPFQYENPALYNKAMLWSTAPDGT